MGVHVVERAGGTVLVCICIAIAISSTIAIHIAISIPISTTMAIHTRVGDRVRMLGRQLRRICTPARARVIPRRQLCGKLFEFLAQSDEAGHFRFPSFLCCHVCGCARQRVVIELG